MNEKCKYFNLRIINTIYIAVLSFLIIGLFFIFFIWTYPGGDDLFRAGAVREAGLIWNIAREYFEWSGRWLGVGLEYLIPNFVTITKVYPMVLLSWGLIYFLSMWLFCVMLFDNRLFSTHTILSSIVLYAVLLSNFPALNSGLYYMTGGTENMLGVSASVIFLYFLIRKNRIILPSHSKLNLLSGLILCLCALAIPGFHELFGIVFCMVLTTVFIASFLLKRPAPRIWFIIGLCALIGLFIVVLAPGNYARLGVVSTPTLSNRTLISIVQKTFSDLTTQVTQWIISPSIICTSLLFILLPGLRDIKPKWFRTSPTLWMILIPTTVFLILSFCFCFLISINGKIPGRTLNGIYMLFFFGWFLNLFVFTRKIALPNFLKKDIILTALITLLAFSLFYQENIVWGIKDINKAPIFLKQMIARENIIYSAIQNGIMNIELENEIIWPRYYRHVHIDENPYASKNGPLALYAGANTIRKKSDVPYLPEFDLETGCLKSKIVGWIFGKKHEIKFRFNGDSNKRRNIKLQVFALNRESKVSVTINGECIATHKFKEIKKWEEIISEEAFLSHGINTLIISPYHPFNSKSKGLSMVFAGFCSTEVPPSEQPAK